MVDHIPDAGKMVPRCEPPEHLRGVDGWHWVQRDEPDAEPFVDYWYATRAGFVGFWDCAGEPPHCGYRYLSPMPRRQIVGDRQWIAPPAALPSCAFSRIGRRGG